MCQKRSIDQLCLSSLANRTGKPAPPPPGGRRHRLIAITDTSTRMIPISLLLGGPRLHGRRRCRSDLSGRLLMPADGGGHGLMDRDLPQRALQLG